MRAPLSASRFHDVAAFRERVDPWLLRREAENNLLIGLVAMPHERPPLLVAVTDGAGGIAGVALQTPPHNLVLADARPAALDAIVTVLAREQAILPGVIGPSGAALRVAEAWASSRGLTVRRSHALRVMQNRRLVLPRRPVDGGHARLATVEDLPIILGWATAFARDTGTQTPAAERQIEERVRAGWFWLWQTDRPGSMAAVARRTPNGAGVAYVYTPDPLRGRGYASAVTAALTAAEQAKGRLCFLFTDLANPTSNKIYQAIGYTPVADIDEYRFA
jgi:predicted GNAT family acetyltransferase